MHLVIPFAAPPPEVGRAALGDLSLPTLAALLAGAGAGQRDEGDALSFTPPHERVLARARGLVGADGCLPWAAHAMVDDGLDPGARAWALLTPVHWHLGTDQVTQLDPHALELAEAESRALLETVRDLFEGEGYVLAWGAPLRWYAAHESLAALRTASPDRVCGRNVDPWLGDAPAARVLRRLQSEAQMRWFDHPLNRQREAAGLLPVNSFWASGCGRCQATERGQGPTVADELRRPALAGDWAAWREGWAVLDAGPLAALRLARDAGGAGRTAMLTLCGERHAVTWALGRASGWRRWLGPRHVPRPELHTMLVGL